MTPLLSAARCVTCRALPARRAGAWSGVVLAGCLAVSAGAQAQGVEPGQWQFWRSGAALPSSQAPASAPSMELCVAASAARDPLVLVGEPPGDSACRVSAVRRVDAASLAVELTCPDGKRVRATVSQPDARQFSTRLDHTLARSPQPGVVHIHGRRVGECPA